jgi:diguanylate cyclase (GGDEF)-like protein
VIDDLPPGYATASMAVAPDAWFDATTGIPGPAFWEAALGAESARCARYGRTSTVVLAEVVGFDDVASEWGQELALKAVVDVVAVLRAGCRGSDYVARLSDDRIGMILTETDEVAAINMIERVRDRCDRAMRARTMSGKVAFGWASPRPPLTLRDAVARAEELLRREAGSG